MPRKRDMPYNNSVIAPTFHTATFYFESTRDVIRYHEGDRLQGRYGRYDNPSWLEVESSLAALDECEEALLFPSGMSAISTTLLALLKPNDKIVFTGRGYRNIRSLCFEVFAPLNISVTAVSPAEITSTNDYLEAKDVRPPKVILVEMPSNPHLYLADIATIARGKPEDTILIVDSTFASPINFKPKRFGADLVIHSCTKYIGGHADLMAGDVAGDRALIARIRRLRDVTGAICDANTASLLTRSIQSLNIRMDHMNKAGMQLSKFLENHSRVERVYYTGLNSHPHSALADKYLNGHGGVVSFELKASSKETSRFVDALQVPFMGTNFGSPFSMVEQCSIFTYYKLSPEERLSLGIRDNLVRYSLGFEPIDEIVGDLEQAIRLAS